MPDYTVQGIDEGVGYDEAAAMGALTQQMQRAQQMMAQRRRSAGTFQRPQIFQQSPLPQMPAQPHHAVLRSYLGMGYATWTSADATDKLLQVAPQESFRGERLIIDLSTVNGPSAGMVLLRVINVGTQAQSPSVSQPAPAAMFSAAATYSKLDLQVAFRAMELQVLLGITAAPGGTAAVTAAVGFYGAWIR